MELGLKDKVAVITGAALHPPTVSYGSMGEETARILVAEGAKVVLADIKEELGEKLAQELRAQGGEAIFVRTDVSKQEEVKHLVDETLETFGTVDILVNAAGCRGDIGTGSCLPNILLDEWNYIFNVHMGGTLLCTQEVARRAMIPNRSGKIVNISSLCAHGRHRGESFAAYSAYFVVKAAISKFTVGCAAALGRYGINVNAVSPGNVLSPMDILETMTAEEVEKHIENIKNETMLHVAGTGRDIAEVIVFLVSDPGSYITADDVNVSAGTVVY